jgi:pimeloyl-ACP methyl ester carboxylesterase
MPAKTPLTGTVLPVTLAQGFTLTAPGITGVVEKYEKGERSTRGPGEASAKEVQRLLSDIDATLVATFEVAIENDPHLNATTAVTRAGGVQAVTAENEPAMVFTAPKRKNVGTAVLYTDESGVSRWIWPDERVADAQKSHFYLPREGAEVYANPPGARKTRGPITKTMRRVVNVIAWVTDEILENTMVPFIQRWEEKNRPYGLHAVKSGAFGGAVPWSNYKNGRALLLLHGTFSTGQDAFDGLIKSPVMAQLEQHYQGRIFAFNHPSLHHTPTENVAQFLQMLPPEVNKLDLDLVTHSRGGLVGRELSERLPAVGKDIRVNRAIFVAGPHNGTILTDRNHWTKLIDAYTNLLTSLPDTPVAIAMEAIIALVKIVGGGTVHNLPGLQAMLPGGDWIKGLNAAPKSAATYYAMAAQYMPSDDKLLMQLGKRALMMALNKVFGENSDMVVPTKGCYEGQFAAGFPIPADKHVLYPPTEGIHHINFFQQEKVNEQLRVWLTQP